MASVTNYKKHGYSHGLENMEWQSALKIFCQRRSGDIVKYFGHSLCFDDLISRIYLQGVIDGKDMYENKKDKPCPQSTK